MRRVVSGCLLGLLVLSAGCTILGLAGSALPPPTIKPAYNGLSERSAGVLVWVDQATLNDFSNLQLDIARSLQEKLTWSDKNKHREIERTSWPAPPESIIRDQQNYPRLRSMSLTELAPRYQVERLICVEIYGMQTRAEASLDLYRGSIVGSVQVVEVSNGKATVAYQDNEIRAFFPKNAPAEGILNASDIVIYQGTVDAFTTELANRFLSHPSEEQ
jgi:hypothetical protein